MSREEVLRTLKECEAEFRSHRVKSLALFGSVARDEARQDSDIDILVEFEGTATYDRYFRLKSLLEDRLNTQVDLVTRNGVRKELLPEVDGEAVYVT
ncbi:MAG: nucleotidyltransferase family protein [Candidatus Omnitrophica bacterium]|nr:nucleotidyltransferase family protein [Candidatus Omnitrophota bacterium]